MRILNWEVVTGVKERTGRAPGSSTPLLCMQRLTPREGGRPAEGSSNLPAAQPLGLPWPMRPFNISTHQGEACTMALDTPNKCHLVRAAVPFFRWKNKAHSKEAGMVSQTPPVKLSSLSPTPHEIGQCHLGYPNSQVREGPGPSPLPHDEFQVQGRTIAVGHTGMQDPISPRHHCLQAG